MSTVDLLSHLKGFVEGHSMDRVVSIHQYFIDLNKDSIVFAKPF